MFEQIISYLQDKLANPILDILWDNIVFLRFSVIILLSILVIIYKKRKFLAQYILKEKYIEHDKKIFLLSNDILDESKFDYIIQCLKIEQYDSGQLRPFDNLTLYFEKNENNYLIKNIDDKKNKFSSSLNKLYYFCITHFHYLENSPNIFKLYPDLNPDRCFDKEKNKIYFTRQNELFELISGCEINFKSYRLEIKNSLFL